MLHVTDESYKSASVVADVENRQIVNNIDIGPSLFDIREIVPVSFIDDSVPTRERRFPLRMSYPSLLQHLTAYDPHEKSSHFQKLVSIENFAISEVSRYRTGRSPKFM